MFPKLDHFTRDENWGDPDMMEHDLLYKLDNMRDQSKFLFPDVPFIVFCGYELTGHSKNSYHKKGAAVDGFFPGLSLLDQFLLAERLGFGGIGLYSFGVWHYQAKPICGMHLDSRHYSPYAAARWAYIAGEKGEREQVPWDSRTLVFLNNSSC